MEKLKNIYARHIDGSVELVTFAKIKRENPGFGFPSPMSESTLATFGCEFVYRLDGPSTLTLNQPDPVYEADGVTLSEVQPDPIYSVPPLTKAQKLVWDNLPTRNGDGVWVLGYQVLDKTQEELADDRKIQISRLRQTLNTRIDAVLSLDAQTRLSLKLGMFAALRGTGSTVQQAMTSSRLTPQLVSAFQDLLDWQEDMLDAAKTIFRDKLDENDDSNWVAVPATVTALNEALT